MKIMSTRSLTQISIVSLAIALITLQAPLSHALSGKQVYMQTCVACHGANGKGTIPGAPDFTDSTGVLTKSNKALMRYITTNQKYPGVNRTMPVKGGNPNLTDQEVGDALDYIRQSYGKKSSTTVDSSEQVKTKKNRATETSIKKKQSNDVETGMVDGSHDVDSSANATQGAIVWASTCSGCHNARSPSSQTPKQWQTVMLHMRRQAKLTGKQTRDILQFLQNSSQ
mgnify:CR=1 FL=1